MPKTRRNLLVLALGVALFGPGCAHRPPQRPAPEEALELVPDGRWPRLVDDLDIESLVAACTPSVAYLEELPKQRVLAFGPIRRTAGELARGVRRACAILESTADADARTARLHDEFLLLRSVGRDGRGEVLFTGYYEPILEASRRPVEPFVVPVYGVPDDLIAVDLADFGVEACPRRLVGRVEDRRLMPYPERDAIEYGAALSPDTEVLGWVADPVDLFFLHVQGSGTLVFPDGSRLRAGFAATNGRPYRSIGRLLIDDGLVASDAMSMQAIRTYLAEHPDDLRRVLGFNPSFVFFRPLAAGGGPLGCYGQPVTAGRSIATDRDLFPAPILAWVRATAPAAGGGDQRLSRFVLNQDTGGSIRGPGRVDLFFGQGDSAGDLAGRTKHTGELYFLVPR
jgi:membrane-bound lytic murein transglycosylase A